MSVRVDKVVTSGTFELDGGRWEVDNNVWLLGDGAEVVVIDAAHDADAVMKGVGLRRVVAILCTHGHNDHVNAALEVADRAEAPVLLHPDDQVLWEMTHARLPDGPLRHDDTFYLGDVSIQVLHTPGHAPGACCFRVPQMDLVFTGDTLFRGGPGATGRSFSDFDTIIESIRDRLLPLPPHTRVLTGHGEETAIGDEAPHLQEWVERGS